MVDNKVRRWLGRHAPGASFLDVGPLWGTAGEMVTWAHACGATSLAVVDHVPFDHPLWQAFAARLRDHNVPEESCRLIVADAEAPGFADAVGQHDLVYCNGLLYHTPSPWAFLRSLRTVTASRLVLGSVVLLPGLSDLPSSVFVPALAEEQRRDLATAYAFPTAAQADGISWPEAHWTYADGTHDARPFWWLHSRDTIRRLLELTGFVVDDEASAWDGRCSFFFCRVVGG